MIPLLVIEELKVMKFDRTAEGKVAALDNEATLKRGGQLTILP